MAFQELAQPLLAERCSEISRAASGSTNFGALSPRTYDLEIGAHRIAIQPHLRLLDQALADANRDPSDAGALMRLRTTRDILISGLFVPEFYLDKYPDIREAGVDPLDHYVRYGDREGRQPNPAFSPDEYRQMNMPSVAMDRLALEHYFREGEPAGCKASAIFDPTAYLEANPQLAKYVDMPLFHFLRIGRTAKFEH
jgi:hypothetical protein